MTFEHHWLQIRARRIDSRRQTCASAPDNYYILHSQSSPHIRFLERLISYTRELALYHRPLLRLYATKLGGTVHFGGHFALRRNSPHSMSPNDVSDRLNRPTVCSCTPNFSSRRPVPDG